MVERVTYIVGLKFHSTAYPIISHIRQHVQTANNDGDQDGMVFNLNMSADVSKLFLMSSVKITKISKY